MTKYKYIVFNTITGEIYGSFFRNSIQAMCYIRNELNFEVEAAKHMGIRIRRAKITFKQ